MQADELAVAVKGLYEWALTNAPEPEPEVRRRLREHFGHDVAALEVVSEDLSTYDHVNFQVALEAFFEETQAERALVGLAMERGFRAGLAELAQSGGSYGPALEPGPVEYVTVDLGDRVISCLKSGLIFIKAGEDVLVALLTTSDEGHQEGMRLEVMGVSRMVAERWLARIRELMRERNVYRGKVLAFGGPHPFRPALLTVRSLPDVKREAIVLPEGTLERIERHTAGLARHRDALRAQGQHIKRGLLLHGPPGTGKTLTVMYLARLMTDRTVVVLTGEAMGAIGGGVRLARSLEPAMVVVEDVDLIALERSEYTANPLLFELLNAMDGLDADADVIFVLTTNRAELLEPALASRPGRIDLAVELPLPDETGRRALLQLYSQTVEIDVPDWTPIVEDTDGTSPAFIRELVRHSALQAAEQDGATHVVTSGHVMAALRELRHNSGSLTATLLGADRPKPHDGVTVEHEEEQDDD